MKELPKFNQLEKAHYLPLVLSREADVKKEQSNAFIRLREEAVLALGRLRVRRRVLRTVEVATLRSAANLNARGGRR